MSTPAVSLILAGPTAVGKSSLALAVAERVGAEIVSADSRQVYQGMDIGTATPSHDERDRVRHHGLDLLDPADRVSSGALAEEVKNAITDIGNRGRPALVVAGSTLYVHALVEGLADLPQVPASLEAELSASVATPTGAQALFEELQAADPVAVETLDVTKSQRLVRYVGVWRHSGQRPSELWEERRQPAIPHRLVVLTRPRDELYARIERRVDAMIEAGLMDEVARLADRGGATRRTLEATIGYRELLPVLDGDRELAEAVRLIKRNTRRYAKRQLTWYRRYDHAVWFEAGSATVEDVLRIAAPWPGRT